MNIKTYFVPKKSMGNIEYFDFVCKIPMTFNDLENRHLKIVGENVEIDGFFETNEFEEIVTKNV